MIAGRVAHGVAALVTLAATSALAGSSRGYTSTSDALSQSIGCRSGNHRTQGCSCLAHRKPVARAAALRHRAFAAEGRA
jgi:hypothetical protein